MDPNHAPLSQLALACPQSPLPTDSAAARARLAEVQRFAVGLMTSFGLSEWSFGFNRRKQSMGTCFYHRQGIELSVYFVSANDADSIRDTVLHEIAHALVGPGHGHDAVWKMKCQEIGAKPERCDDEAVMPGGRWRAECPQCRRLFFRHRRPKRLKGWFCRECRPERGALVWKFV